MEINSGPPKENTTASKARAERFRTFLMGTAIARRTLSFSHIVFVLSLITLFAVQLENFANDPGVGWHLASGELVVTTHEVPKIDPFLNSNEPRRWVSDQWLSDVILHSLFAAGSWPLLYNVLSFVYLATFFLLLLPKTKELSGSLLGATIATFLAFKLGQVHFILRPVLFSFPLFAFTYLKLLKAVRTDDYRGIWILVPLFILWANTHPSFITGLAVVTLVPLGITVDEFLVASSKTLSWRTLYPKLKIPLFLSLILFLVTLINPYGFSLHLSILDLGSSKFFMNLNEEWLSPNFDETSGKMFISVLGYILLGLALGGKPKWCSFEYLTLALFTFFSLNAIRFFPYFGIVSAPLLSGALVQLGSSPIFKNYISFAAIRKAVVRLEERETFSKGLAGLVLICLLLWGAFSGGVPLYTSEAGPSREKFPHEALQKLNIITESEGPQVVFSPPTWGGFITFMGQGEIRPIIDDRNTLLGEVFYKEYLAAVKPGGPWLEFAKRFGATYILFSSSSPLLCEIESAGLEVIHRDSVSVLVKI